MKIIGRDIVSAVIISKDGKVFLAKKNSSGVYSNCWHIPGGGIDEGETKEQALIREMQEEISLDVSKYNLNEIGLPEEAKFGEAEKILKTGERVLAKMHFFVYLINIFDKSSGEIKLNINDEFLEYIWAGKKEIKKFKLAPPTVLLFKHLGYL